MKDKSKLASIFLVLAGVFMLLGSLYYWYFHGDGGAKNNNPSEVVSISSEEPEEPEAPVESEPAESVVSEEPEQEPEPEPEVIPAPEPEDNPYKDYFDENSDMVAYINIPDTIIDFPVMWTPEDEEYYLKRGFDKKHSEYGCLILDTDSSVDPFTTNLIIHGHNYKHKMFGDLSLYESEDYRDEHPYIYLSTRNERLVYEVIAAFRSQVYYKSDQCFKFYKFFQADTEEEFLDFYNNIMDLSYYKSDELEAEFGDRFITLSTCSYHVKNGRFVVVAKETEVDKTYK